MKTIPIIALAAGAVAFAACDSKEEQRRENALERKADALEDQADATREQGEKTADAIEKSDPGANSAGTQGDANAVRRDTENKADALEDAAKTTREKK